MKPTATPMLSTMPPLTRDWLYYRLYGAVPADLQALLESVVAPLAAEVSERWPGIQWFFLRYVDPLGPHVRLRLRVGLDELPAVEEVVDRHVRPVYAAPSAPPWPSAPRDVVDNRFFGRYVYEPEYDKYGDGDGIAHAEDLFHAGSVAALGCFGPHHAPHRLAYGALHTVLALDALPAERRTGLLEHIEWFWTGQADGEARRQRTRRTAARLAEPLTRSLRALVRRPEWTAPLSRYHTILLARLDSGAVPSTAPDDHDLVFHHVHMMNNRLGVAGIEEAVIARVILDTDLATIVADPPGWAVERGRST
jgi:lantibiotic biosynthesis dehydratase-like protein